MTNRRQSFSGPVRLISRLPFGRRFAMRWWNRMARIRGPIKRKTYFGTVMECDPRDSIQATILHFGTWEPNVCRAFELVVRPGDSVVDLGANIGFHSLLLSKLVGDSGTVIAVEALPELAEKIKRHANRNARSNIIVVNAAIADFDGTLQLYRAPVTNLGMSSTRSNRSFEVALTVPAVTLLDLPVDLAKVTFIKCDIEGAEVPVLWHLLRELSSFNPRLSVEVEASTTDNPEWPALFDAFLSAGFKAYEIPNRLVTLWDEMLDGSAEKPMVRRDALPPGEPDLLFSRLELG